MLIASKSKIEVERMKLQLSKEFEMKELGEACKILGMEIHQDKLIGKVWLSLRAYLQKELKKFRVDGSTKPVSTSLAPHFKISAKLCSKSNEEWKYMMKVPYSSAVGGLMYTMVCTRTDISLVVSMVSRYMHDPHRSHC